MRLSETHPSMRSIVLSNPGWGAIPQFCAQHSFERCLASVTTAHPFQGAMSCFSSSASRHISITETIYLKHPPKKLLPMVSSFLTVPLSVTRVPHGYTVTSFPAVPKLWEWHHNPENMLTGKAMRHSFPETRLALKSHPVTSEGPGSETGRVSLNKSILSSPFHIQ